MPTVIVSDNTGADYSGCENAGMRAGAPTTNYSNRASNYLRISDERSLLIKFSGLSNISTSATVSAVTFGIYNTSQPTTSQTVRLQRLLRLFVESEATYNIYSTGNSWTTAGAYSNGNDQSVTTTEDIVIPQDTGYNDITSTQAVADFQGFIDGTYANDGYVIRAISGGNSCQIAMSEGTDGQRPTVSITYTEGGDTLTSSDGFEFSDTVSLITNTNMTLADTYEFSDTVSNSASVPMSLIDGYEFSDTSQSIVALLMSLSDSHVFSDQVLLESGNFMNLSDGFEFSDSSVLSAGAVLTLNEGYTFTDALSIVSTAVLNMSDGYILTDIASLSTGTFVEGPVTLSVQVKQSVFTITIKKPTFETSTKQPNFDIEVN